MKSEREEKKISESIKPRILIDCTRLLQNTVLIDRHNGFLTLEDIYKIYFTVLLSIYISICIYISDVFNLSQLPDMLP